MELRLGKMSSREIAQWFGISYNYYKGHIGKFLDLLIPYCDFEAVYGGIIISNIYCSVYDKTLFTKDKELVLEEITSCIQTQDGLATVSGMARKFTAQEHYDNENTARRRLSLAANQLFGETKGLTSHGEAGVREYMWAIKVDDCNHYRMLTEKENEIFNNIISSVYCSEPEKVKKACLLEQQLKQKKINVDEYFEQKDILGLNLFTDCIFKFRELTGEIIIRCTKHELMESYDFIENEEA